jgi:uncharacterized protein YcbX
MQLWRYPIKSLRGEPLREAEIAGGGIPGDRAVHVVDERLELITARTRPDLVLLPATLAPDGEPLVDGQRWDGEEAGARIRATAGGGLASSAARAAIASTTPTCSSPPTVRSPGWDVIAAASGRTC